MIYAITIYMMAMTAANLTISAFGPWFSPINSFLFIGLDLALRDWLHTKIKSWQIGLLIVSSGLVTYTLNPSAGAIAVASAVSFTAASVIDWSVFSSVAGSWLKRSNASNISGAAVDSILFPTIAFGVLMPHIIAIQFAAKVSGGFLWSVAINRAMRGYSKY